MQGRHQESSLHHASITCCVRTRRGEVELSSSEIQYFVIPGVNRDLEKKRERKDDRASCCAVGRVVYLRYVCYLIYCVTSVDVCFLNVERLPWIPWVQHQHHGQCPTGSIRARVASLQVTITRCRQFFL